MADDAAKPKQPWDEWDDAKKAQIEKAIELAEGIKMYRSAGGIGVGAQYAPHSRLLAQQGGLSSEQATLLARYRMYKQGAPVPTGPRSAPDRPEERDARGQAFLTASKEDRAKMFDEQKAIAQRELGEAHFDSLVAPPKSAPVAQDQPPTDNAKALLASAARPNQGGM